MPIATIIAILQSVVSLAPEIGQVVPIIEKILGGTTPTEADLATLDSVAAALNVRLGDPA
jgi:hypothetical protein